MKLNLINLNNLRLNTAIGMINLLLAGFTSFGGNRSVSYYNCALPEQHQTSSPFYFETQINNTTLQNLPPHQRSASPTENTKKSLTRLKNSIENQNNKNFLKYLIWVFALSQLALIRQVLFSSRHAFLKLRRWPALVLLLFLSIGVYGQCPVTISADYCTLGNGQVRLTASSATSYTWNTGATTQTTSVPGAGIYAVTATGLGCNPGNNTTTINVGGDLAVNGNFSAGKTGFGTAYAYTTTDLFPEGNYAVTPNSHLLHTNFWGYDHTLPTGTAPNNYMAVNGNRISNITVWTEGVTVLANTNYYFSVWVLSLNSAGNYARLRLNINGGQVTGDYQLLPGVSNNSNNNWQHYYTSWNSGAGGPITISITDLQTAAGGNDFGIDDISFSQLNPVPLTTPTVGSNSPLCPGSTINLTSSVPGGGGSTPLTYHWTGPNSYSSNLQNPSITNATTAMSGSYTVTVTDYFGCLKSASVTVTVNAQPAITNMTSTACSAVAFTVTPVNGTNGVVPAGTTYSWPAPTVTGGMTGGAASSGLPTSIAGMLTNPTSAPQTATYTVTPTMGTCTGSTFTVTVTVNPKPAVTNIISIVCSGVGFTVTPADGLNGRVPSGTTYSWPAPIVTGGMTGGAAGSGASNISGILNNPTNLTQTATYTVTPTSGTCPGSTFTVTVSVNPKPAVTVNSPPPVCAGTAATITATPVPAGSYTYVWTVPAGATNPGNVATFTSTVGGTYSVVITSTTTNCVSAQASGTLTVNALPATPAVSIDCHLGFDQGILNVTSPTGSYQYSLDGGTYQSGASFANVANGTHSIIARNNSTLCLSQAATVNVNCGCANPPTLTLNSNSGSTCVLTAITLNSNIFGGSATQVTLSHNGTGTLNSSTFSTSPFAFTYTPGPTDAGNIISISVTTNNPIVGQCNAASATYSLTVNPATVPNFDPVPAICTGESLSPLPTTSANGLTGIWAPALNNTTTTTYTFTPTAGQCATTATLTITVNQKITPIFTQVGPICSGAILSALPSVSINGYTGTWAPALNNTATTTYTFTPTSGQCSAPATMIITVNPLPVVPHVSNSPVICPNDGTSFTVGATGNAWQWEVSTDNGVTWTDIGSAGTNPAYSGFTNQTLSLSGIAASNNGFLYRCRVTDNNTCSSESNSTALTVNPLPVISSDPAAQQICPGNNAAFSVSAAGTGLTYQWQADTGSGFTNVNNTGVYSGATASTLSITAPPGGMSGYVYQCIVKDYCNQSVTSQHAALTITILPVTAPPTPATVCEGFGNFTTFTVDPLPNVNYQWQVSSTGPGGPWTNLSDVWGRAFGVTSSQVMIWSDFAATGNLYRCILTLDGCSNPSGPAQLTINPQPLYSYLPNYSSISYCTGSSVALTANISGDYDYLWYKDGVAIVPAETAQSIVINSPGAYSARVTNRNTGCSFTRVPVTVTETPSNPAVSVSIAANPATPICQGTATLVTFTATAGAPYATDGSQLSYQWTLNGINVGINSSSYSNNGLANGDIITCILTVRRSGQLITCASNNPAASNAITMVVNSTSAVGVTINSNPVSPICPGTTVVFTAAPVNGGTTPAYQWQISHDGGATWFAAPGATNNVTYSYNGLASGDEIRCILTSSNTCASGNPATSNALIFSVTGPTQYSVVSQLNAGSVLTGIQQYCYTTGAGVRIGFTNTDPNTTYTLLRDGVPVSSTPVFQSPYYWFARQTLPGVYTVTATPTSGGCSTTLNGIVTIYTTPVITGPANSTICAGNNTSFSVVATGASLSYQWQVNPGSGFILVSNTGVYSGATTATLNITGATAGIAGYVYQCVVTNGNCSAVTSSSVTLTVNSAPAITVQPTAPLLVCSGSGTRTISVTATGTGLSYSWRKDGTAVSNGGSISGQGSATLTFTNPTIVDAGNYDVVVSGSCLPPVTSNAVVVTVNNAPVIFEQPFSQAACLGSSATFSVIASGLPDPTYQWRKGGVPIGGATNSFYTIIPVTAGDAGNYDVVITNSCGNVTSNPPATLTVNTEPAIANQTYDRQICLGSSTSFSMTATGTGLTYQWEAYHGSLPFLPLTDDAVYSGVTTATLTLTNPPLSMANTVYRCVVSGSCGTAAYSSEVKLTFFSALVAGGHDVTPVTACIVYDPPKLFINNPVIAGGSGPYVYQWQLNGIDIPGVTVRDYDPPIINLQGIYNYNCVITDQCGSVVTTAVKTITIAANNTAGLPSSAPTLCINTALTNITIATTGATGIGAPTGLPAGVTVVWVANEITISGTPTASGTFNYSIPLTGGCGTVNATGTITVTPANIAGAPSSNPTLCINTALTNITISTTGATGIGTPTGLPAGVTVTWAANVITVSGTPTVSGIFNYSIPLTGGCGAVNATGNITVNPAPNTTLIYHR